MNKSSRKTQTEKKEMATKPSTVLETIPSRPSRNRKSTEAREAYYVPTSKPKYLLERITSNQEAIESFSGMSIMDKLTYEYLVKIGDIVLEG